ncbi:protein FRA10AC1-like [Mercenaria mercenaria]|uniref:protein FRA10AC1-like n=1 Tax=Mercenaria mercenaria TaxID=6596 RepID=UPI00234F8E61|nr:protein FRA10AC1-like [Mercenaria mercenaria]
MADSFSNPKRLAHQAGSYDSEFEFDSEAERKRRKYEDLAKKEKKKRSKKGHKRELEDEYDKEEGRIMRHRIVSMNAFDRHKLLVNNYLTYYCGQKTDFQRDRSKDKTDMDVIRENHKFLWTEDDDPDETWSKKLAKKYYDKLFKEYCISDLSRYKENKVALRWRIEKEVQQGKGQFICGNKKCSECEGLRSWEVNFAYMEDGQKKNALVKLRLCPDCSYKLNYHHRKKEIKLPKRSDKQTQKVKKHKYSKEGSKSSDEDLEKDTKGEGQTEARVEGHKETEASGSSSPENIWSGPAKIVEEKSREDEFDEYFADMFL